MNANIPIIPETITVHLGLPDSDAANVTLNFPDYIKNVASSEIYPTWPENAIRANIYAQISFALNRIYTEYYPSRGYPFDITSSTAFDQSFVNGREIFENVSRITDDIFYQYISRRGAVEPLFAVYCNGTTTTCNGLSQWGSVSLAGEGAIPYEILTNYYGENIDIVTDAMIQNIEPSTPSSPLRFGSVGNAVKDVQVRLNRISANYPSINKIAPPYGIFGVITEAAVREFQRIFYLTQDGLVGNATWYKIQIIYNAVKRVSELESEGISLQDVSKQFNSDVTEGMSGLEVSVVQYYLNVVALYNSAVLPPDNDGYYGQKTRESILSFEKEYGLEQDGIVDEETWNVLFSVYFGIVQSIDLSQFGFVGEPFPGTFLSLGSTGENVMLLQTYINAAAELYTDIPEIPVTGTFDTDTRNAIFATQATIGLPVNGIVGPITWDFLSQTYSDIESGKIRAETQFPGENIGVQEGGGDAQ